MCNPVTQIVNVTAALYAGVPFNWISEAQIKKIRQKEEIKKDKEGGGKRPSTSLQPHPHFTGMKIPHGGPPINESIVCQWYDWFVESAIYRTDIR